MKPLPYNRRPGRIGVLTMTLFCTFVLALAGCTSSGNSNTSSLARVHGIAADAQGLFNPGHTLNQQTSTFSIKIDATQLVYEYFVIPGKTGWISSKSIQTLALEPGTYNFQIASGWYADFTFSVTQTGTIDYDHHFDTFLSGRGTSTLGVVGLQVTLDARYLSGAGITLVSGSVVWITYKKVHMVPGSYYQVQQGSGVVANLSFQLGLDGTFLYIRAYDGFLAGNGTSTLQFLGYPLLVDARAAGGYGITLTTIWNMPFSTTSVEFADLLPASFFAIQVNTLQTKAIFSIGLDGKVNFDSSLSPYLDLQTFDGLTLLHVKGPLPT